MAGLKACQIRRWWSGQCSARFACLSATFPMLEAGKLPPAQKVAQNRLPNQLASRSVIIGRSKVKLLITRRCHRLHSLVVLDPVTNPLVAQSLRWLIHHHLQTHTFSPAVSNDLNQARGTPTLLPETLANACACSPRWSLLSPC